MERQPRPATTIQDCGIVDCGISSQHEARNVPNPNSNLNPNPNPNPSSKWKAQEEGLSAGGIVTEHPTTPPLSASCEDPTMLALTLTTRPPQTQPNPNSKVQEEGFLAGMGIELADPPPLCASRDATPLDVVQSNLLKLCVEERKSVLIFGKPGVGKTFTTQKIVRALREKDIPVQYCSFMWAIAANAGHECVTLQSYLGQ